MGASSSSSFSGVLNKISSSIQEQCSGSQTISQKAQCNIKLDHCNKLSVTCENDGKQGFSCSQSAVVSQAAQAIASADAKTKAGLGFASSDSVSDIENKLSSMVTAQCGSSQIANQLVNAGLNCEDSDSDKLNFLNSADQSITCLISVLQNQYASGTAKSKSSASGMSIGAIIGIILAIIVVVVVIVIAVKFGGKKKGGGGSTTVVVPKSSPTAVAPKISPVTAPVTATGGMYRWRY